nr:hypothetical protein CFP56_30260 [Quercus suber]
MESRLLRPWSLESLAMGVWVWSNDAIPTTKRLGRAWSLRPWAYGVSASSAMELGVSGHGCLGMEQRCHLDHETTPRPPHLVIVLINRVSAAWFRGFGEGAQDKKCGSEKDKGTGSHFQKLRSHFIWLALPETNKLNSSSVRQSAKAVATELLIEAKANNGDEEMELLEEEYKHLKHWELEHAKKQGAKIYAKIHGYGMSV